ncbi:MAG TPA: oligosaccharide flippase family protein [Candidatus Merdisoma merdipullorum]|nr:oligosaccharide flippase family protein [Candidatus Merdisoma merdipullorum]
MKASFWFLICSFLQKGISMITTPIFTRILSTSEYGQFSVFNSWMSILTPIVCLNLYSGVYAQGIVKFEHDRDKFGSSLQGLVFSLISAWVVIYFVADSFWNEVFSLSTLQMLCMFLLIWTSASYGFWSMDQRADFKYHKQVIITIAASVMQPTISIWFMVNSEDKVTARIVGMAVTSFALYTGTFIVQMIKGRQFFSKKYWIYALRFNIPLLPHYLSMTILSSSDRIMISNMVGDDKAGIYSLSYSISMIMTMFNSALLQTVEPWIYRKLKEKKIQDLAHVAYPCFILIAALNILLIIFAPEIVAVFAPPEYQEAIWCIPPVVLSVFFTFLYTFFATFEFYYEKTRYIASATVGGALLNIVLNYFGIQLFGYVAAAYTTLFSYILYAMLHYYFMRRICKTYLEDVKPYSLKLIVIIAGGSLLLGFGFMVSYLNTMVRYILIFLLAMVVILKWKDISSAVFLLLNINKQDSK